MPKNTFNFTIKCLNNSISTRSKLKKLNFAQSLDCSFCHLPEALLHAVASYKSNLEEGGYIWRHNSALQILANYFRASQEHLFTLISHAFIIIPLYWKIISVLISLFSRLMARSTSSSLQFALRPT